MRHGEVSFLGRRRNKCRKNNGEISMEIAVSAVSIPDILVNMRRGSWLVPHFQREFVWSTTAVRDLLVSVIKTRPVGMITLWAQADDSGLPLEPISVPDNPEDGGKYKFIVEPKTRTNKYFAILDGKQRCTALAIAFGGLVPDDRRSRFAGRFFLDTNSDDEEGSVVFYKEADVLRLGIGSDGGAIGKGLFPFASSKGEESLAWQWIRYIQEIRNSGNYDSASAPGSDELDRRERIVKRAFEGINNTRFAVLVVPDNYRLDEICDIFDKLNTTGTKVSTVDLIHSWLYADTAGGKDGPVNLRQWMASMEGEDGAVGWIDARRRPELAVQFVTAAYAALDNKPAPRGGGAVRNSVSIKSSDLLATPTVHWLNVISRSSDVARILLNMQRSVIGAEFPWTDAPYPAASTVYFACAWKSETESSVSQGWSSEDLDKLFRAFYWRNAIASRYDQGFLTKVDKDIKFILDVLERRPHEDSHAWASQISDRIDAYFKISAPPRSEVESLLKRGRHAGALQKALVLPMLARVRKDLLNPAHSLGFPDAEPSEIHHFFPVSWCNSNKHLLSHGSLDEFNYANSVVNLFPLSRASNNVWKARHPAQVVLEGNISFDEVSGILSAACIDRAAFELATGANPDPIAFWERRATLYAEEIERLMRGMG